MKGRWTGRKVVNLAERKKNLPQSRYPKEVFLKDGTDVVLRPMTGDDTPRICRFHGGLNPSLLWFMKENPCDPEVIRKWMRYQEAGNAFSVVADHEGDIVGYAALLMRPHGGRKHVGRLRIYVAEAFRSKQLGTWLVFDMIQYAMEIDLELLRTDFIIGIDDQAIDALRKLDFVSQGVLKNYVKDDLGGYRDYQIMIKHLHREWSDF